MYTTWLPMIDMVAELGRHVLFGSIFIKCMFIDGWERGKGSGRLVQQKHLEFSSISRLVSLQTGEHKHNPNDDDDSSCVDVRELSDDSHLIVNSGLAMNQNKMNGNQQQQANQTTYSFNVAYASTQICFKSTLKMLLK
ncbi:hypothetical protein RDWZM_006983 [Blomia tropicalis]|uniref:Uncharacterized protein n=1 Tax=Blomia tropicalis TaxID=40697 RepID=A0A9Q0RPT1_BLOTA|nr:hypothetical protein RDWZM_006983 [Blomia tropicalis]